MLMLVTTPLGLVVHAVHAFGVLFSPLVSAVAAAL